MINKTLSLLLLLVILPAQIGFNRTNVVLYSIPDMQTSNQILGKGLQHTVRTPEHCFHAYSCLSSCYFYLIVYE